MIETDKNFAASYLVYRLFMGDVDGGFAAARSMALYGRMGGGAQLDQLQAWTSNETNRYSQSILRRINSQKEFLDKNCTITKDGTFHKPTGRRISACVPMHTFGHPVELDEIMDVCNTAGIALVEDAAESLGSKYKGRHTGTFGLV